MSKPKRPQTPPGITPRWSARRDAYVYLVRYRAPDGTSRGRTCTTLAQARTYLAGSTADRSRGDWVDPAKGRRDLDGWADEYLRTLGALEPQTRERYRSALASQIRPALGALPIASIDQATVRTFLSGLRDAGYARGTVHNARTVLSGVLGLAADAGAIRVNPARGAKIGKAVEVEQVFLTAAQVEQLADAIEAPPIKRHGEHRAPTYPQLALAVRFAAYTGLRAGELWALRVRNVDLLRRRVHVVESATTTSGKLTVGPPKSKRRRTVALPAHLVDPLVEHVAGLDADALVFAAPRGGMMRHGHFYGDHYLPAVARAGLPAATVFHSLRHTCAALLAAAGLTELEVMAQLGHAQPVATYRHLFPGNLDRAAAALDQAYERRDVADADVLDLDRKRRAR
jgi:integrase